MADIYVTEIGEFDKDGDGRIMVVGKDGKAVPFATGLDDPKGMVAWTRHGSSSPTTSASGRSTKRGRQTVLPTKAFPIPPFFSTTSPSMRTASLRLRFGRSEGQGRCRSSASNVLDKGKESRDQTQDQVALVTDGKTNPKLKTPNGLAMDGMHHPAHGRFRLAASFSASSWPTARTTKIADGFDGGDGLAWDNFGRLFISSWKTGKVLGHPPSRRNAGPHRRRLQVRGRSSASIRPASSSSSPT